MAHWQAEHLRAGGDLARNLFDTLARETAEPPGITRKSYGEGEKFAYELMVAKASKMGAEHRYDAAGNLFITYPGKNRSKAIQIGSHLDTVPHGGNFDGAAGIVAGMAVMAVFNAANRKPPFDLTIVVTRAEESCWFPHSYIGSKTALGIFDAELLDTLKRSDTGKTLAEHMKKEGFDPEGVRRGETLIDKSRIVAHIEPHIEQAPVLVNENLPVGFVTGIRGSFRYRTIQCIGSYSHSGAMPREYRRDAVAATGELIFQLDTLWTELLREGRDLTITFGEVSTNPEQHSFSKVAGETHICLDVRSQDQATLDLVRERFLAITRKIGERRNVRFDLGELTGSTPAVLSETLQKLMRKSADQANVPYKVMASGAGHDTAMFALAGIPSAMIFIRNENGSHNPYEAMDMDDFDKAVVVLAYMLSTPVAEWTQD
jgi:N-carbamoyl-L-amino-acid hydrolase